MEPEKKSIVKTIVFYGLIVLGLVILAILVSAWVAGDNFELPFMYGGFD